MQKLWRKQRNMTEIVQASENANRATAAVMMPHWMENLYKNLPLIRPGRNAIDIPHKPKEPCIIVGAGPSLSKFNHLNMIKASGWSHPILSCDKKLLSCLLLGIVPYVVGSIDASEKIAGFYSAPIIKKHAQDIYGVFSTMIHPKVIERWRMLSDVYWFNPLIDSVEKGNPSLFSSAIWYLTNKKGFMSGVGNVGSFLWNLATALECDPIILVGFDFSEQVEDVADAIYFKQYLSTFLQKGYEPNKASDAAAEVHQPESNPDFICDFDDESPYYQKGLPVRYLVNPIWKTYRDMLAANIAVAPCKTINATGNGCLHSGAKNKNGDLILADKSKFESVKLEKVLDYFKEK
jgi:hypothetical protein